LASAGTNLHYGISKGADAASSVVWGAVSVAVSIVFALSWPAVIRAVERRQWTLVPMALAALVVTGAYSVTAALGSASGGRTNAATLESAATDARAKAQAAYDAAKSELDGLKPSRPIGELEALVTTYTPGRKCRFQVPFGRRTTVCSPPVALAAELGRARRRAELEGKMDTAQSELERVPAPKQANSDAAALAGFLAALGVGASAGTMNRLLVLLAVLVIECGGGLALVVGMSLSEHREQGVRKQALANDPTLRSPPFGANTANTGRQGPRICPERSTNVAVFASVRHRSRKAVGERLLEVLRERGGPLQTSIRRLADHLGTTPTTLHTVTGELIAARVVAVVAGRQGSVFRLLNA
jgi:hypothetical protein